jgi:CBS domain containing-hemolysin-like protein
MVEEAETEGSLESDQSELIQNAIEFDALEAVDVLTPRPEIVAIDIEMTEDEIAEIFLKTGFSRLPVYENDLDNILGVLNQKDFHNYIYNKDKTVSDFIKPVVYAPESMSAAVLLKRMQKEKCQIAIVVDEYGGTTGLVAMEDILEELVGEIYDEHEEVESQEITKLRNGSYRVLASANVEKMFDYFDDEDEESDATTVNGWVVRLIDKLPEIGDTFSYRSQKKIYEGHVTSADDRKALEINLTVEDIPEEEEDTDRER